MIRIAAPLAVAVGSRASGLHGNYRSALAAHPGQPQGRPSKGSGSQPTSFARSARTRVLPVPHIPDGLTITPATEVRQGPQGTGAIMPDKGKVDRPFRYIRQDFFVVRTFRNLDHLNTQL